MLKENVITRAITSRFFEKFNDCLTLDVAIVGAGPSGLVAAKMLAKAGLKVAVFDRKLAPGGGTWGGGMLFNEAVVQTEALPIVEEFGIRTRAADEEGYYTLDSVEMASGLIFGALQAGATIFNSISVEDIVFKDDRVCGVVILWTSVEQLGWHVDPLTIMASAVVDGTGHPSEILKLASAKAGVVLDTPTGNVLGEKPMWAESGEASTLAYTKRYYPGLYASGMSANNAGGGYRMGPIFGGMLLSGEKVAQLIIEDLHAS